MKKMLVLPQEVEVKCVPNNKKHYEEKGYIWKYYAIILVNVEDLSQSSKVDVNLVCDYCGKPLTKKYVDFNKQRVTVKKDACSECKSLKQSDTILETYGINNIAKLPSVRYKFKATCLKNFGTESPMQNKEIYQKSINTCIEKYGCENVFQNIDIQNKFKVTCMERYGTEIPLSLNFVQNKRKQTNLDKYGFENVMSNNEIKLKALATLSKNSKVNSSKQQIYINDLLLENKIDTQFNYLVNRFVLDIVLLNHLIAIEYDGGGHELGVKLGIITIEEFKQKERIREIILKRLGWKFIRIKSSKDYLPDDDILISIINIGIDYLNSNHSWFEINIDEKKLKCKEYEIDYDFGKIAQLKRDLTKTL